METETAEDSKLGEMLLQRNKMLVPNTDTISTFSIVYEPITSSYKIHQNHAFYELRPGSSMFLGRSE